MDGGKKSDREAKQCITDVSKYLYFASKKNIVDWTAIYNARKLKQYLDKLTDDGIQVEGQLTKLERIRYALLFLLRETETSREQKSMLSDMEQRLKKWESVLRKGRASKQMRREQDMSENPADVSGVAQLSDESVVEKVEELVANSEELSNKEKDVVASYLLESLLFGNSQRPAAVLNLTMDEYHTRKEYTDSEGCHYVQFKVSANTQQLLPRKAMVFSSPPLFKGHVTQNPGNSWTSTTNSPS